MQQFAKKAIKRVSKATQTFVRSNISDSVVILNYHRVNAPTSPANNLTVSIEKFREHMEVVRRYFEPTPLCAIESGVGSLVGKPSKRTRVVVTFDDGYADTYLNALPAMAMHDVPGTVFVTTGTVGMSCEFWWDELEELLIERLSDEKMNEFLGEIAELAPRVEAGAVNRSWLYLALCCNLKAGGANAVEKVIASLRRLTGCDPLTRDPHRAVTLDELIDMDKHPLMEVGAHTVTHPSLGRLDRESQHHELKESKKYLEEVLGHEVRNVAYPFGCVTDFNNDTMEVSKELGYRLGLTTVSGVTFPKHNPYALPRMFVQDWGGDEFERRLRRLARFG